MSPLDFTSVSSLNCWTISSSLPFSCSIPIATPLSSSIIFSKRVLSSSHAFFRLAISSTRSAFPAVSLRFRLSWRPTNARVCSLRSSLCSFLRREISSSCVFASSSFCASSSAMSSARFSSQPLAFAVFSLASSDLSRSFSACAVVAAS